MPLVIPVVPLIAIGCIVVGLITFSIWLMCHETRVNRKLIAASSASTLPAIQIATTGIRTTSASTAASIRSGASGTTPPRRNTTTVGMYGAVPKRQNIRTNIDILGLGTSHQRRSVMESGTRLPKRTVPRTSGSTRLERGSTVEIATSGTITIGLSTSTVIPLPMPTSQFHNRTTESENLGTLATGSFGVEDIALDTFTHPPRYYEEIEGSLPSYNEVTTDTAYLLDSPPKYEDLV